MRIRRRRMRRIGQELKKRKRKKVKTNFWRGVVLK